MTMEFSIKDLVDQISDPQKKPKSRDELADFIDIRRLHLKIVLDNNQRTPYYKTFDINKNNSKTPRTLHAVQHPLKEIQRKALDKLSIEYQPSKHCHGFVSEKSIITNAKQHCNKRLIIKFDIKDFFPSINFKRIRGMFKAPPFKFGDEAATTMAQIACLNTGGGALPQGGVLSPYISNMICRRLDIELSETAKKYRCHYTRYADDMTFSTNRWDIDVDTFIDEVYKIIRIEGFAVNEKKRRILTPKDRQIVTGIVVNDGLNVTKKYARDLRATIHNCKKNLDEQIVRNQFKRENNSRAHLIKDESGTYYQMKGIDRKVEVSKSQARNFFILNLIGRLNFYVNVISENNIHKNDPDWFEKPNINRRFKFHADLMSDLRQILNKNKIVELYDKSLISIENKNPYCFLSEYIKKKNKIISSTLSAYRKNKPESKNNFPEPSQQHINQLLESMKDSVTGLGVFTHHDCSKEISTYLNILLNNYHPHKFYLTIMLRKVFDRFIDKFESYATKNYKVGEVSVCDTNELKNECKKLKESTRFDESELSLSKVIEYEYKTYHEKLRKYKDKVILVNETTSSQLYTCTGSVKKALSLIFESMLKNTHGDKIYCNFKKDRTEMVLEISDNSDKKTLFDPNGKLGSLPKLLRGVCDYYIEYSDTNGKRLIMNMHEKKESNSLDKSNNGFIHRLIFKPTNYLIEYNDYLETEKDKENKNYKVLVLDNNKKRREELTKNLNNYIEEKQLSSSKIESFPSLDFKKFEEKTYDLVFCHINNTEYEDFIKKEFENRGNFVLFEISGSYNDNYSYPNGEQRHKIGNQSVTGSNSYERLECFLDKFLI